MAALHRVPGTSMSSIRAFMQRRGAFLTDLRLRHSDGSLCDLTPCNACLQTLETIDITVFYSYAPEPESLPRET